MSAANVNQPLSNRFSNIGEYLTNHVHHGKASKKQRINTRNAVIQHIQTKIRDHQSTLPANSGYQYSGCVTAGSYYNHLSVRGKRPDFDLLFIMMKVTVLDNQLDKLFGNENGLNLASSMSPSSYLKKLQEFACSYPGLSPVNRNAITVSCPSVTMCSADTEFDLLPALGIFNAQGNDIPGLYLIPADNDRWKFSFTGREKTRLQELEKQLPGIRDTLKIMKYLNQTQDWGIPSFAFTCLAWNASEQLIIYKWPHNTSSVSWDKVKILYELFKAALKDSRTGIMHMFFPRENLLAGINVSHVLQKMQMLVI